MNRMISIIVPMYNMEKYILELLNSIKNQSYQEYEVILIDDGSTDKTAIIVKDFIKNDSRFKLILKSNQGVSSARNTGLDLAKGDYIFFADADDLLEEDSLKNVSNSIGTSELGYYGYCTTSGKKIAAYKQITFSTSEFIEMLENGEADGFLWNKIFKSEIIRKYNLRFEKDIIFWEDLCFVIKYLNYINSLTCNSYIIYKYRLNDSGVTSRFDIKKQENCFLATDYILKDALLSQKDVFIRYAEKLRFNTELHLCLMSLKKRDTLNCFEKYSNLLQKEYLRKSWIGIFNKIYLLLIILIRKIIIRRG